MTKQQAGTWVPSLISYLASFSPEDIGLPLLLARDPGLLEDAYSSLFGLFPLRVIRMPPLYPPSSGALTLAPFS